MSDIGEHSRTDQKLMDESWLPFKNRKIVGRLSSTSGSSELSEHNEVKLLE